jgi:hypothetical protein
MGEAIMFAFGLCGVHRTALTQEHFEDARFGTNVLMGEWSANGVNLWQIELTTTPLVQGQPTYPVPNNTVVILDAYYSISNGTQIIDRIMTPISRTEYANYPNKLQQGAPTVFWHDRLLNQVVNLWLTPNGQQASFSYYRLRQTQDSVLQNGTSVEIPIYFQNAFVFGLGEVLSYKWAPDRTLGLKAKAAETWDIASRRNTEIANVYVSPQISGYYR